MKKIIATAIAIRDLVRGRKVLARTAISLAMAFGVVLGVGILTDIAYNFMASHSGLILAAGLIAGQCFLYAKDLGNIKANVQKLAADPAGAAKGQSKTPRGKASKPAAAPAFATVAKEVERRFNRVPDEVYEDEDAEDEERFEDDPYEC